MKNVVIWAVIASVLAGCSLGRLNPFNWFDRGEAEAQLEAEAEAPDLSEVLVSVSRVRAEQTTGGVILRATGLAPRQGYHDARLKLVGSDGGVLRFEIRAFAPEAAERVGSERSRLILTGLFLPTSELTGISRITVSAATNATTVSAR
jgi:hypothetical protein